MFLVDVFDQSDPSREVDERRVGLVGPGPLGEVIVRKGNHEAARLAFPDEPDRGADWPRFGGRRTRAS